MSLPNAITREDFYLNKIANPSDDHELPDAITRQQHYLKAIAENAEDGSYAGLFVTITGSGTTYTADHTYAEIRAAIESGKNVIVLNGTNLFVPAFYRADNVEFFAVWGRGRYPSIPSVSGDYVANISNLVDRSITISENDIIVRKITDNTLTSIEFINNQAISESNYAQIQSNRHIRGIYNNSSKYIILELTSCNLQQTEFDFVNVAEGITAHVAPDKTVTITTT